MNINGEINGEDLYMNNTNNIDLTPVYDKLREMFELPSLGFMLSAWATEGYVCIRSSKIEKPFWIKWLGNPFIEIMGDLNTGEYKCSLRCDIKDLDITPVLIAYYKNNSWVFDEDI